MIRTIAAWFELKESSRMSPTPGLVSMGIYMYQAWSIRPGAGDLSSAPCLQGFQLHVPLFPVNVSSARDGLFQPGSREMKKMFIGPNMLGIPVVVDTC